MRSHGVFEDNSESIVEGISRFLANPDLMNRHRRASGFP
jgi:hypothetical protein